MLPDMDDEQRSQPTETEAPQSGETPASSGTQPQVSTHMAGLPPAPGPSGKKKKVLLILLAVLLVAVGAVAAYMLLGKDAKDNTHTQTHTSASEGAITYDGVVLYVSSQDNQSYLYDAAANKSTPYVKLAEGEQLSVSPDGKTLLKTRANTVETAASTKEPEFSRVYADADAEVSVTATWLPDGSGMLVNATKTTSVGEVPRSVHTITRLKKDGSDPQKLLEYPVVWGAITIEGVDLERNEFYVSEVGEGGLRKALATYRLSDGGKIKDDYRGGDNDWPLVVANGKAYKAVRVAQGEEKEKAQIIEIDITSGQERVVYETATIDGRTFQQPDSDVRFSEGISVETLSVSSDKTSLYFNEVHNKDNPTTTLRALNLSDHKTTDVYTPSMTGSYITVEAYAVAKNGLVGRVQCGGCTSDEYEQLGAEWVFIDPVGGKSQLIQKTAADIQFNVLGAVVLAE